MGRAAGICTMLRCHRVDSHLLFGLTMEYSLGLGIFLRGQTSSGVRTGSKEEKVGIFSRVWPLPD